MHLSDTGSGNLCSGVKSPHPPLAPAVPNRRGSVGSTSMFNSYLGVDPRVVWDAYEQQGRLGSGECATVYRAREKETGCLVALKKIEKSAVPGVGKDDVA